MCVSVFVLYVCGRGRAPLGGCWLLSKGPLSLGGGRAAVQLIACPFLPGTLLSVDRFISAPSLWGYIIVATAAAQTPKHTVPNRLIQPETHIPVAVRGGGDPATAPAAP